MAQTSSQTSPQRSTIGFVGIGNMGAPMVRCLARAGHKVVLFDLDTARAKAVAGELAGATVAATLGAVGAAARVVITMVPDSAAVRRAVCGAADHNPGDALVDGLASGAVVVDMSSSFAPDTVALGLDLAARGIGLVDAPVSGGVGKAVSGTLAIMAGGETAAVDHVASALSAMGQVHRTGQLGSGHALKALNNYVSAAGLIATCEALLVARRFGLDPSIAIDVINASTGRNNTTENKAARYLIPERYDSGFALSLMKKDVGMAADLARTVGVDARELAFVQRYLDDALHALGGDADHTAVMAFAKRLSDETSRDDKTPAR